MEVYGYIIIEDPLDDEDKETCLVCGDEDWLCDECFHEVVSIGDID